MNYRRIGRWAAAGLGVAVAGAGLWWLKERKVERPEHEVLRTDGEHEVRRYPPMLVAETVQIGTRDRALGTGFGVLADYLFGTGREGDPIAMTVPVLSTEIGPSRWATRFVMPRAMGRARLPAPPPGIEIVDVPAREIAVLGVAGKPDDRVLAARRAALLDWVAAQGLDAGTVRYAFYNSPFLPGPLRHNEVWVELN